MPLNGQLKRGRAVRRVSLSITPGLQAALESMPTTRLGRTADERILLRHALAEGICALADHYAVGGELRIPFRFEVLGGLGRAFDYEERAHTEQMAIERALRIAMIGTSPPR